MGWATEYIKELIAGKTIQFRPRGSSMEGKISSGQLVTVEPATINNIVRGDIVLCSVGGNDYLHLVKAKDSQGRLQIGNNRGKVNGWTRKVYGKCIKVEP